MNSRPPLVPGDGERLIEARALASSASQPVVEVDPLGGRAELRGAGRVGR
jgi:hypothetical protein